MSNKYLLDASALLALLQEEQGAEIVSQCIPDCVISAVNLAEVASILNKLGMPEKEIQQLFIEMDLDVLSYGNDEAIATGGIRRATQRKGLSLGDRACLAVAKKHNLIALTADKAWLDFQKVIGVKIQSIR